MIGLANVTDFPTALDRFTAQRGADIFGWSNDPAVDLSHREVRKISPPLIIYHSNSGIGDQMSTRMQVVSLGIGSIGGFILGACLFLIVRVGAETHTGWANFYKRRGEERVVERRIVSASGERGLGSVGRNSWKRRVSRTVIKAKEG
jgi:hypothetical protein